MSPAGSPYLVGLVQMAAEATPGESLRKALDRIGEAARRGARLVCLPELFLTEYFCQREDASRFELAEPVPGPTTAALAEAARRLEVVLIAPLFERRAPGICHNTAAVLDADGSLAGLYRKMHIPEDPGYHEKFYFTPGDLGFPAFTTRVGPVAALICWDQWYPEAARLAALAGALLLLYPTAIGWHPDEKARWGAVQKDAWRTVQRGHAVANGVYLGAVNRVGHERPEPGAPGIEFWGGSFLCDPQGVVLAEGAADREEVLLAEVDPAHLEEVRRNWPFLRDRRIDAYEGLDRRFLGYGPAGEPRRG